MVVGVQEQLRRFAQDIQGVIMPRMVIHDVQLSRTVPLRLRSATYAGRWTSVRG